MRIWSFWDSGSAKCVMRNGVGLPGNVATSVVPHVTIPDPAIHPSVFQGGRLGALGQGSFHPEILGMAPRGGGCRSGIGRVRCGEKEEVGDLLQALSLLQSVMSPEDFAKY